MYYRPGEIAKLDCLEHCRNNVSYCLETSLNHINAKVEENMTLFGKNLNSISVSFVQAFGS